tara:strand:- start:7795 stop:8652 length:858 start_codon:yes stop_codon:yes gene_type:complete
MNLENYTDRARKVLAFSNQEAQRFNHEDISAVHILLGLIKESTGVGANALKNMDVDLRQARLEIEKRIKSGPDMVTMGKLPYTRSAKSVFKAAEKESGYLGHTYIGTEHLLLGVIATANQKVDGNFVLAQVFKNLNIGVDRARAEVVNLMGRGEERSIEDEAWEKIDKDETEEDFQLDEAIKAGRDEKVEDERIEAREAAWGLDIVNFVVIGTTVSRKVAWAFKLYMNEDTIVVYSEDIELKEGMTRSSQKIFKVAMYDCHPAVSVTDFRMAFEAFEEGSRCKEA